MLDRQPVAHCGPNKLSFLPFNFKQVAHHLSLGLLARFVRQCALIVGFGVDLGVEPRDQCILVQPSDHRKHTMHLSECD